MDNVVSREGDIVIFAKINGNEYICRNPNQYKIGKFLDDTVSVDMQIIGKLQNKIKYELSDLDSYSDSVGNKYERVISNYTVVIKVELIGGRPPILRYP